MYVCMHVCRYIDIYRLTDRFVEILYWGVYADERIPPGPLPVERAAVRNPRNTPRFGLAAGSARVLMIGERGSFEVSMRRLLWFCWFSDSALTARHSQARIPVRRRGAVL